MLYWEWVLLRGLHACHITTREHGAIKHYAVLKGLKPGWVYLFPAGHMTLVHLPGKVVYVTLPCRLSVTGAQTPFYTSLTL